MGASARHAYLQRHQGAPSTRPGRARHTQAFSTSTAVTQPQRLGDGVEHRVVLVPSTPVSKQLTRPSSAPVGGRPGTRPGRTLRPAGLNEQPSAPGQARGKLEEEVGRDGDALDRLPRDGEGRIIPTTINDGGGAMGLENRRVYVPSSGSCTARERPSTAGARPMSARSDVSDQHQHRVHQQRPATARVRMPLHLRRAARLVPYANG